MSAFQLPRIKVCGLTRGEDVARALGAGAEALGFVHYPPSPRSVDAIEARRLTLAVPGNIPCVGVFVDVTPEDVLAWCEASGTGVAQLCGTESPGPWVDFPLPILRRVAIDDRAMETVDAWKGIASGYLLDHPSGPGGTGRAGDPEQVRRILGRQPAILAGGLHGANVGEAIRELRPGGVDASSRLEVAPGRKDPLRIQHFVEAAQAAFASLGTR